MLQVVCKCVVVSEAVRVDREEVSEGGPFAELIT
jgi:hypothetical protein